MPNKNRGSGKLKDGFDNFVRNMSQKHNMPQETILDVIEQMIKRKRKELKECAERIL